MKIAPRRYLPSLSILRSFEAAARHESFTLASEELNLTQSAISRQIKELEKTIGVPLFRRVGRRVKLTKAGAAFANGLELDLERIRQTVYRAIAAGENATALKVATLPTFASRWLIPRLSKFEDKNPDIQVSLSTRLEPFDLDDERFDAALHFGAANWPDAEMVKLFEETMVAVTTTNFKQEHEILAVKDLASAPLIHLESRPTAWADWFKLSKIDTFSSLKGKQFSQFSMIISGAISGLGAALIPRYLIENELADGRLVQITSNALTTENAYYVVTPKGEISDAVSRFSNWLIQEIAEEYD